MRHQDKENAKPRFEVTREGHPRRFHVIQEGRIGPTEPGPADPFRTTWIDVVVPLVAAIIAAIVIIGIPIVLWR